MYIDGLEAQEWEYRKDRTTWKHLARIRSRSNEELIEPARSTLEEIEDRHPEWSFEGTEKERLPHWTESHWGAPTDFSTEDLIGRTDEEIARILIQHEEHREGLMDAWRNLVSQSPARAVDVLDLVSDAPDAAPDIWEGALRGMSETDFDAEVHSAFLLQIGGRPDSVLRPAIHPATRFAEYIAAGVEEAAVREEYFSFWDKLLPVASKSEVRDNDDCLHIAINHPVGKLTEGLMKRMRADLAGESTGLCNDVQTRAEALLESEERLTGTVTAIICSRLSLLHSIDPEWTESRIIPRLSWQDKDPETALCAWQGYLWGTSIGPSLWPKIKPHYLDAVDHEELFSVQYIRSLAQLLAVVGIEFPEGLLSSNEAGDSLRALGDTGRVSVIRWVESRLDGAGDRAPTLWREKIGPWIQDVWPPENDYRTEAESVALSRAAIQSGEAFPDAVEAVIDYLIPVGRIGNVVHPLLEKGLSTREPESSLLLLSKIIGPDTVGGRQAGSCLNQIEESAPAIANKPEFARLQRLGSEKGWLT
jgi:hypothetical protein